MSACRILLAALLAASALAVLAPGAASARRVAELAKFCKAVEKIGDDTSDQPTQRHRPRRLVEQFKAAASGAAVEGQEGASNTMADYFDAIAGDRRPTRPREGLHVEQLSASTRARVTTFSAY